MTRREVSSGHEENVEERKRREVDLCDQYINLFLSVGWIEKTIYKRGWREGLFGSNTACKLIGGYTLL